jgi:hypothetical protein
MRLTSSFAVFRADPEEQGLAKARWLAKEGRTDAAEREYRDALRERPDVAAGWIELVELLRRDGRHEDALHIAEQAEAHFGPDAAMPLVLKGSALSELGRTRDAVQALEAALERDGNLALAWHELGYAAYRVGEYSRALLALDRAFALEPHTDTLMLRGRILRQAGQYEAADVAFEAAHQATEHDIPQRDAAREVEATRRAATFGGKRPAAFSARERWFVETGTAVMAEDGGTEPLDRLLARCLAALPALVARIGWHPALVSAVGIEDEPLARVVGALLGVPVAPIAVLGAADEPLLVAVCNGGADTWARQAARLARWKAGACFALVQHPGAPEPADVAGTVHEVAPEDAVLAAARAFTMTGVEPLDVTETAALATGPRAPWPRRCEADLL